MKMAKKILSVLFAAVLMLAMQAPAFAAMTVTGFSDVDAGAWYADAAVYCRDNGLMNGTTATTFSPNQNMSRAMLVSVLYRMNGSPAVTGGSSFSDIPSNAWYAQAVTWAQQNDVVGGYSDGRFGPNDSITREQMAAILWRNNASPEVENSNPFADQALISDYATTAVSWARGQGIITGTDGNRFNPKGTATRAQVAVMMYRLQTSGSSTNTPDTESPDSKILVAYFSRTGNTETVAQTIQRATNGELFEIVPATAYPTDYQACLAQAERELSENTRPTLSSHVKNIADYDVIFVGFPIWHGNTPMPIRTFLEEYDLTGKTIVPFSTSGSSGIGSAMTSIRGICSNSTVLDGLSVTSATLPNQQRLVEQWIAGLNLN